MREREKIIKSLYGMGNSSRNCSDAELVILEVLLDIRDLMRGDGTSKEVLHEVHIPEPILLRIKELERITGRPCSDQEKSLFDIVEGLNKELLNLKLKVEELEKNHASES